MIRKLDNHNFTKENMSLKALDMTKYDFYKKVLVGIAESGFLLSIAESGFLLPIAESL